MKLGISSYSFTWATGVQGSMPETPLSPSALIDMAERLEVSILQLADNMPVENLPDDRMEHLMKYAESKGISLEMGGRGLTVHHTLKCLNAAEKLGSPLLRMVIDAPGFQPGIPSVISIIRDFLPEFRNRNIKLAIENHDRFKAREFENIVLETDPEVVGICLDSVNSLGAGEGFETVSEILAPYTVNLHIKDFTIYRVSHKMGFVIEGRPAGGGMLDIPGLLRKIESYRRCNSAILELWTPPADNVEQTLDRERTWAEESIKYLRNLFK